MPSDQLSRFLFEHFAVRGALVNLQESWQSIQELQNSNSMHSPVLGEALAAAALLTSSIKFRGNLGLQLQSSGQLRLVLAQCSDQGHLRGITRFDPDSRTVADDAVLSINLEGLDHRQRYQGIVAVPDGSLSDALAAYFTQSEQLETRFWLAAGGQRAGGLMLQQLPQQSGNPQATDPDAWNRVNILAGTLTAEELLELPPSRLLRRLFHEEDVRLFDPRPLQFQCSCSPARVADMLRSLGRAEVDDILEEQNQVEVHCEYCNRPYRFDALDVAQVFHGEAPPPPASGSAQ